MAKTTKGVILAITLNLASWLAMGQDPHFSQFYANPLYVNPAFAGVDRCPTVHLNYRNQYPAMGVYQTYSASYDQYVEGIKGGLGFIALQDEAGDGALSLTEVSGVYSYHLAVSRKFSILAGFQATFRQRALQWDKLTFPDQIDEFYGFVKPTNELPPTNQNVYNLDLSVGFIGFTKNFFVGVAAHHLTEPDEAFLTEGKLPFKFTAHAGASIPLGRKRLHNSTQNMLIPNVIYQNQGGASQTTLGLSFNRSAISGGLGYRFGPRNPDAIVILLGFDPGNIPVSFGYSYDYTVNDLTNNAGGAHELSLKYKFPCRVPKKRLQQLQCPKF